MRILIASPYLPWPLISGGNAAQFSTLKCLEVDHQFTLVCPVYDEAGIANAKELQAQLPLVKIRAVFCGSPPPTPQTKPNIIFRFARWLIRYGRRVLNPPVLPPTQPTTKAATVSQATTEAPYYPFNPLPEKFLSALENELSKGVDLCQIEFVEMLPLGSWLPPQLPKLFVHHQLHFVYARRFLDARGRNSFTSYLEAVMHNQEQAYLQKYHGVIVFSEGDRNALLPWGTMAKLFASPFPIPSDVGMAKEDHAKFDGRFLFVASEEHGPNRDALEWLLAEVWPLVLKQLPSYQLQVIGRWSDSSQTRYAGPGVHFTGFVPDLTAALRGGIMLVPLRIGSGIRVKIMVALAQGVPVVSTTIGCEGMPVTNGYDILVRDQPEQFASGAVSLAKDTKLQEQLSTNGKKTMAEHYSPEAVRQSRNEIYSVVVDIARTSNN